MDSNRSHIPQQPNWFIAFRIIQLVLTVLVLAFSAYGLATSEFAWDALCLAIFTVSKYICFNMCFSDADTLSRPV